MSTLPFPRSPKEEQGWSPTGLVEQAEPQRLGLMQRWYRMTTPPAPAADASFVRREADRKARLLSIVAFFFLVTMIFFLPATWLMGISTFVLDLAIIVLTMLALFVNRSGRTMLAGIVMVATFEVALAVGIVLITPLDVTELQLYDLFIIGELLAVSLLPVRWIFFAAFANSIFILIDLFVHAKVPALAAGLHAQLLPALVRPIGLQFIIAGVVFIWVNSASKAIERANRAELVASLEHTLAEQRATIEEEKRLLDESIRQIVQAHVDSSNTQLASRINYPPAKELWPLVGVINSLWVRLQHSQQTEKELAQLKHAITVYAELIQKAAASARPSLPLQRTGTVLDPLILSVRAVLMNGSRPPATPTNTERKPL